MKPHIKRPEKPAPTGKTCKPEKIVSTEFSAKAAGIIEKLTLNVTEIIRRERCLMFTSNELLSIGRRTGLLGELHKDGTTAIRQIGAALGRRNLQALRLQGAGDKWFLPSVTMDDHARKGFWQLTFEDRVALYHLIRDSLVLGIHLNGYVGPQPIVLDASFWKRLADHRFTINEEPLSKFACPDGDILKRSNSDARSMNEAIEHVQMALIGGLGSAAPTLLPEEPTGHSHSALELGDGCRRDVSPHLAENNIRPILDHTPPYCRDE